MRLSLGAQEIFFVATPNGEKQYTFELDVAESAKDFGQLSGTYSMVRLKNSKNIRKESEELNLASFPSLESGCG